MAFNRKCFLLAGVAVALTLLVSGFNAQAQEAIRIGTSSSGSAYYTIAIGAGEIINKYAKVNTTVESVGGSSANVNAIGRKKIEFALANSFASYSGYNGLDRFKDKIELRLVLQGHSTLRYIFSRKGTAIKSIKDLEGKTVVGIRRALPELALVLDALLKVHGVDKSKVKIVATSNAGETLKALEAGSVDAAMIPFSAKSAQVARPMQNGLIKQIFITKEKQAEALKMLPEMMYPVVIKPGNFENQPRPMNTFGFNSYFIARSDVDEDIVYRVMKALAENTKEFSTYHKTGTLWTAERALKNFAVPFHSGAVKYLKEKGLWTAEIAAKQDRLLKRQ